MTEFCKFQKTIQNNSGKTTAIYYVFGKQYLLLQLSSNVHGAEGSLSCGSYSEISNILNQKNKTDFNNIIELFYDLQQNYKSYFGNQPLEIYSILLDIQGKPKLAIVFYKLQQPNTIIYTPANNQITVCSDYVLDEWFDDNKVSHSKRYSFIEPALNDPIFKSYFDVLDEI